MDKSKLALGVALVAMIIAIAGALYSPSAPVGAGNPTYRGDIIIESAQVNDANNGLEFHASPSGSGFGNRIATVYQSGSNTDWFFQSRQNSDTWSTPFVIRGVNSAIGIGTTTPAYTLDTYAINATNYIARFHNNSQSSASDGLLIQTSSGNNSTLAFNVQTNIGSSFPSRFVITGVGNVGISTTTPLYKFYATAGTGNTDSGFALHPSGGGNRTTIIQNGDLSVITTNTQQSGPGVNLSLQSVVYGAGAFGNVGISTTTITDSKLHVNNTTATSTISATVVNGSTRSTTLGGRIILQDTSGGTCTEIYTKAGTITGKAITCPN